MNKRVFHIDQECFIVYVEDMSSAKERFLRIGNSPIIKEFGENLTFVSLLSKLYPGDTFGELDIFRPKVDKKIIGLKEITSKFLSYLKKNDIDTKSLKVVYAEEEGKLFTEVKTEKDFLDKIESNSKIKNHSFASFYNDGNIRIFNKNEVIFDLRDSLKNSLDEKKEILQLSKYFIEFYKNSYKKSGIIYSNKSLFVFSKNNFACITDSNSWIKDAIRVGINPFDIELIYVTDRVKPDSLWTKFFISYERKKREAKILFKQKPSWEKIIPTEHVVFLNHFNKPVRHDLGDIKLFFHQKKIIITCKEYIIAFDDDDSFLNNGSIINGEYNDKNIKIKFQMMIDDFKKESLGFYSYNPCIFEKTIEKNDYIKNFWNNLKFDKKYFKENTDLSDEEYTDSFVPKVNKDNFYSLLYAETVKRLKFEGNENVNDDMLKDYIEILKGFNGELLNKNNILIEQLLGYFKIEDRIVMRDSLARNDFIYLDKDVNPFLTFQKELSKTEWTNKLNDYRINYKKKINSDAILNEFGKRYSEIIDKKQFHIEEQERLKRFLEKIIIKEQQAEKLEKIKTAEQLDKNLNVKDQINNKNEMDEKNKNKKGFLHNLIESFKSFSTLKKILISGFILLILILLFFGSLFLIRSINPNNNQNNNQIITKLEKLKKGDERYIKGNHNSNRESAKFHFYMTVLDLFNLTNKVAVDNGYHRIVFNFQKRYVRGKDPDWIFPGNKLKMPDGKKIIVKDKDTMWDLCETFLINQLDMHEAEIERIIKESKQKKIDFQEAKEQLLKIKKESYSEMLKDLVDYMIQMKNFDEIEKYLKKNYSKPKK